MELDESLGLKRALTLAHGVIDEVIEPHRVIEESGKLLCSELIVVERHDSVEHVEYHDGLLRRAESMHAESHGCLDEPVLRIVVHDVEDLLESNLR